MAASTVSKDSEGIYTDLASPYQDVYSTLGQTSLNSPGAQHTEKSGQSPYPYRLAAVCLGLLCALLLAATLVLCVLYIHLCQSYSMLERDLEELRTNNSMLNEDQLQREYNSLEQEEGCKLCPLGWEQFSFKCYYFSTDRKNWMDSRSDCIKRGADLVIIDNEEEQEFTTRDKGAESYWIGLTNSKTNGTWLWVDGTPLQRGFWGSGEPYDRYGFDCAQTMTRVSKWTGNPCDYIQHWICESNNLLP